MEAPVEHPVTIDISGVIEHALRTVSGEITERVRHHVLEAVRALVVDYAKGPLRQIVRETMDEVLKEMRFREPEGMGGILRAPPNFAKETAEPVYDLTLKEYIVLYMRGRASGYRDRPRIWEKVDQLMNESAERFIREELKEHLDGVKNEFRERLLKSVGEYITSKDRK